MEKFWLWKDGRPSKNETHIYEVEMIHGDLVGLCAMQMILKGLGKEL